MLCQIIIESCKSFFSPMTSVYTTRKKEEWGAGVCMVARPLNHLTPPVFRDSQITSTAFLTSIGLETLASIAGVKTLFLTFFGEFDRVSGQVRQDLALRQSGVPYCRSMFRRTRTIL